MKSLVHLTKNVKLFKSMQYSRCKEYEENDEFLMKQMEDNDAGVSFNDADVEPPELLMIQMMLVWMVLLLR